MPPHAILPAALLGGPDTLELTRVLVALGVLLVAARTLGELARRLHQPAVLGELVAGILLGPALLGRVAPAAQHFLFPTQGQAASVLDGLRLLAIVLFLMVAGLEVDLSTIWRRGRAASFVGIAGIAVPFALGALAAWFAPQSMGFEGGTSPAVFACFFATALSISALPVIAKTLMDLYLYRTDFGMTVVAAAVFNDLVGWIVFAVILGLIGSPGFERSTLEVVGWTLAMTLALLTVGRWLIHRSLPWVQAHTDWPSGVLVYAIAITLFGAALSQWIGIHAVFGAFLAGVALGDSSHLRPRTRATISDFVSSFFAPLFFGSIGLSVDFVAHFDPLLCLCVVAIACAGKIAGCGLAARAAGLPARESWAVGYAMNARGMMEIVLGLTALRAGVIGERLFVALVAMAIVTSVLSGPLIQRALGRQRPRRLLDFLGSRTLALPLLARERIGVIEELAGLAARAAGLAPAEVARAVLAREEQASTAVGRGIAVPHARVEGLAQPVVALGLAGAGVDFGELDGEPVRIVFLVLTPSADTSAQLEILADLSRTLRSEAAREKVLAARGWTELLAALRTGESSH